MSEIILAALPVIVLFGWFVTSLISIKLESELRIYLFKREMKKKRKEQQR